MIVIALGTNIFLNLMVLAFACLNLRPDGRLSKLAFSGWPVSERILRPNCTVLFLPATLLEMFLLSYMQCCSILHTPGIYACMQIVEDPVEWKLA